MLADLLDLVLPSHCVGCADPGPAFCHRCRRLTPVSRQLAGVGNVHAAGEYASGLRQAIIAYKERDRRELTGALAGLLASAIAAARDGPVDLVVPVPTRRSTRRARGGDHLVHLLERSGTDPPVAPVLHIVRRVADSAGLDAAARRDNLAGAFAVVGPRRRMTFSGARPVPKLTGARVLIVDDVVTTGATLQEAARALAAAGAHPVGAAVIAATRRRVDPRPPSRYRSGSK